MPHGHLAKVAADAALRARSHGGGADPMARRVEPRLCGTQAECMRQLTAIEVPAGEEVTRLIELN